MSRSCREVASCRPSQSADVYIYKIAPAHDTRIAAITSADELLLLDGTRLAASPISRLIGVPNAVTSLVTSMSGNDLFCAGSSGVVVGFDARSGQRTMDFNIGWLRQIDISVWRN